MWAHLRPALIPTLALVVGLYATAAALVGDPLPFRSAAETVETVQEPPDRPGEDVTAPDEEPPAEPAAMEDTGGAEAPVAQSDGPQRSRVDCPEGFEGNHGGYVSQTEDRPRRDAARSECGKPEGAGKPAKEGHPGKADDPGKEGKPAHAEGTGFKRAPGQNR